MRTASLLLITIVAALIGCSSQTSAPSSGVLASESVLAAFRSAGLPVVNEVVYTDATDPNNLLGRPGQYVEKINFSDARVVEKALDKQGFTIEAFKDRADMNKRKQHLDAATGSSPAFLQYIYVHKNVIVRLDKVLLPKDAEQYESILKTL